MLSIGAVIVTILFGALALICFYFAFKPHKQEDEDRFFSVFGYDVLGFVFGLIFTVCKRFLPHKVYIPTFRSIVFLLGSGILYTLVLFW